MSDRIPRPPVRLAAGLPDGNRTNAGDHARHLLSDDPRPIYFVGRATRKELKHQDDNDGAEIAIIKVRDLEVIDVLPDHAHPGMALADLISALRADRTGEDPTLFDGDDGTAARADKAMGELRDWQAAHELTDEDVTAAWVTYFAGHQLGEVPTWRDAAPELLREFVLAMEDAGESVSSDDPADVAAVAREAREPAPSATFAAPALTAVPDQS